MLSNGETTVVFLLMEIRKGKELHNQQKCCAEHGDTKGNMFAAVGATLAGAG